MVKEEFLKEIDWFSKFYRYELESNQSKIWYDVFNDIPAELFKDALNRHIKYSESNFFPSPGCITKALKEMEEEDRNKPPKYPEFSVMWVRVVKHFPDKQDYEHFPPEDDIEAWKTLYDKVVMIPSSKRSQAVIEAMKELEAKYKNG